MSLTREEVIAYLDGLTGEELGALVADLEARLGLSLVGEPVYPTMVGAVIMGEMVDDDRYRNLVLVEVGSDKIRVLKAVRELTGFGLQQAKTLVESAPVVIREDVPRWKVDELAQKLRDAGAKVALR